MLVTRKCSGQQMFPVKRQFSSVKVVMGLFHSYDGVVTRLAKALSFIVPQIRSTVNCDEL